MEFEPVTQKQVDALIRASGMGAMIIDWGNLDLELGRGINPEGGHCLFNKDGRRIDIGGYSVGLIISQTKKPDPKYEEYCRSRECRQSQPSRAEGTSKDAQE